MNNSMKVSVIIPAKNEALGLKQVLQELVTTYPDFEIIVVNDGSTDETRQIASELKVTVVNQPYSMGNGAAIKAGARRATGDVFIFMDADGQHQVADIARLLEKFTEGYDMVVGQRDRQAQANWLRLIANSSGNWLASLIVNHRIGDLTSGFRVVKANKFKQFLYLLPNGFSYPCTITMAFFRSGYSVTYLPIAAQSRQGKSHLNPFKDGPKSLLLLYKMTVLYSPMKVFVPFALLHFILGMINYLYTYTTQGRFTNMSGVLFSVSIIIFLIGLISEQITVLMYQRVDEQSK